MGELESLQTVLDIVDQLNLDGDTNGEHVAAEHVTNDYATDAADAKAAYHGATINEMNSEGRAGEGAASLAQVGCSWHGKQSTWTCGPFCNSLSQPTFPTFPTTHNPFTMPAMPTMPPTHTTSTSPTIGDIPTIPTTSPIPPIPTTSPIPPIPTTSPIPVIHPIHQMFG